MKNTTMNNRIIANGFTAACAGLLLGLGFVQPMVLAAETALPFKNSGMEEGTDNPAAWKKGPPVAGVEQIWDRTAAHGGKASLCLKKTAPRYFPIAAWNQEIKVDPASQPRKLRVRCWVKAENVTKAIVDVTYSSRHPWSCLGGLHRPAARLRSNGQPRLETVRRNR